MELFLVYLWLKLDALKDISIAITFIGGMGLGIALLYIFVENPTKKVRSGVGRFDFELVPKTYSEIVPKGLVVLWAIFLSLAFLLPDSKQAAILFGTHYAVKAVESPEGQKVMTLMRKRVNDYLDNEIKAVTQEPAK